MRILAVIIVAVVITLYSAIHTTTPLDDKDDDNMQEKFLKEWKENKKRTISAVIQSDHPPE